MTSRDGGLLEIPRVAFDVTALYSGSTGVARYVREVGLALRSREVHLAPFAIGRGRGVTDGFSTRRLRVPLRLVHRLWWMLAEPRAERLVSGCGLVHSTDLIPPPTRLPLVMTVHDLDAARRPELHPPRAVAIQRAQLAAARDRASVVLTSAATATALTEEGVDRDRIVVTTYGVTPLPDPDFTLVPSDPFFLVVGSLNLRKGQDLLVAALARSALASVHLVLAGPEGWGASRVRSAIARHGLENRVTIIGRVSDAQLAGLYRSCIALCVPSRAEGFGIPILEASRLGVPVVASDIPASRELEQAVALFAPAADEQAWATVLERIVDDEDLRASTADRGPAFARRFTWDRVAQITLGAYRKALGTG